MNTYADLYDCLLSMKDDSINDFLKNNWKGKDKQETLFRLFSYLKLIQEFNSYDICEGNYNNGTIKPNTDRTKLFYSKLKDSGDKSDCTLMNRTNNIIIATTSKNKQKYYINGLDIDNIQNIFSQKYQTNYKLKICIIVRDKNELINKILRSKSTSKRIRDALLDKETLIFDWSDLNKWYKSFKSIYKNKAMKDIINDSKIPLVLRFHQELSVINTIKLSKIYKEILWGHVPRSGKSYIMAGTISLDNNNNYLIITTAPNESIEQYLNIFNTYSQFSSYNIIHLDTNKKPLLTSKNIIICSKQFLHTKINNKSQLKWLKDIKFSMRFIDESHYGGSTDLAQQLLAIYGVDSTSIYISATYMKPSNTYGIVRDAWIMWDIEDVQCCKTINNSKSIEKLIQKHGNSISRYDKNKIIDEYSIYPDLHLITWDFNPDVKYDIISEFNDGIEGFSTDSIFLLKTKDNIPIPLFQNDDKLVKLFNAIFGKRINRGKFSYSDTNSIIGRIENITKNGNINSRWFSEEEPLSILCFLPCGIQGLPIDILQTALEAIIIKYNLLPNFEVLSINSKQNETNIVDSINKKMSYVKNQHKKGLLILSGRMCSLAVSLNHCDIVLMLNNTENMDTYFQMMFRSMTEAPNKKCGFVVDLNLQRVASVICEYAIKFINKPIKESIKIMLEQRLIHFNSDEWMKDIFSITKLNINNIINRVYNIYSSNSSNTIDSILKKLEIKIKLLSEDKLLFNNLFNITTNQKKIKIIIDDITKDDDIEKGIERNVISDKDVSSTKSEKENYDVNFIKDILRHLIPLMCLITINNDKVNTFTEMCKWINTQDEEKKILINQLSTWWGKSLAKSIDVINMFDTLYNKYLKNEIEFNNAIMTLKELFCISKNNANELSKVIDKYLIPQELEKKQNAEVSTPYSLRNDMISSIPKEFWSTPKKVFEPCSGKGGFLLDIIHLFKDGLKDLYPDEKERYKIIVEQCLYWGDINSTNIWICKLLIDPFGDYNLNYNEGNTLLLNIKNKWKIDGFDLVIGNPPYNDASGNKGVGHTLWTQFVEITLTDWLNYSGYMVYVHPSLWRQIDHKLLKLIQKYKLLFMEIHNEKDGMKVFRCNTRYDWYILHKIESTNKYKTIIIDEEKIRNEIILNEWNFIPNSMFTIISSLLGKPSCSIINERSSYGGDKKHMSKTKTDECIYPCVYSINRKNVPTFMWSSLNTNGHFNIPKVIYGCGATGYISDHDGNYGMTQWCSGIVCDPSEHNKLIEVLNSENFKKIKLALAVSKSEINTKNMRLFKDKWWHMSLI
jgi:hypothetical protein